MQLTPERLAELRRIAEAATPGPWVYEERPTKCTDHVVLTERHPRVLINGEYAVGNRDLSHIATFDPPTVVALLDEIDTLRAKLDDLLSQRIDEAEAKLATRPVEQVVGELQAENRRLREVAERVVRANKDVDRHGYASLRRMVYALENVLREVQG